MTLTAVFSQKVINNKTPQRQDVFSFSFRLQWWSCLSRSVTQSFVWFHEKSQFWALSHIAQPNFPRKKLHQLRAHLFWIITDKFHLICDKGSRVNYFLKFTSNFHGKTEGFPSGLTQYLIVFQMSWELLNKTCKRCRISWLQVDVFWGYGYGKPLASKCVIFEPNFSMPDPEIEYRHFLPKQNTIWQMNHIAINSLIWTTKSQSLNGFEILKFAAQFLIFLDTHS